MARNNGVAGRWPRRGIAFLILGEPALLRPVKHRRITELPRLLLSLWLTHRLRSTRASIHLLLPSIASIPFWSFLRSLWESTNLSSSSNPWQKIKRYTRKCLIRVFRQNYFWSFTRCYRPPLVCKDSKKKKKRIQKFQQHLQMWQNRGVQLFRSLPNRWK